MNVHQSLTEETCVSFLYKFLEHVSEVLLWLDSLALNVTSKYGVWHCAFTSR